MPTANERSKIRIDGFYYLISKIDGKFIASIYFLYQNGIFKYNGSKEYSTEGELINRMNNFNEEEKQWILKDGKFAYTTWGNWGVYEIKDDNIFIKQQIIGPGKRLFETKGKVIDSETYFISEEDNFYPNKSENYSKAGYYYFRHSAIKPDSSNKFFK